MTAEPAQYTIAGSTAATITRSIERGVVTGQLHPGEPLPSVRGLAADLGVSPTTVAAAYRELRNRGVLVAHDRSRTVVAHRPPLAGRLASPVPEGAVDLASGNPDPTLLPDLGPSLTAAGAALDPTPRLYGGDPADPGLLARARDALAADGVPNEHVAVVAGALDGIERVLEVHLRTGDRVAVEDPGYIGMLDLVRALGLQPLPVAVDDQGPRPDALADALAQGAQALLLVPRAQNPTGAALTAGRARELRDLLDDHDDVLVIEDDHAAAVAGAPLHAASRRDRDRWAIVRAVAKGLGPDLRLALLAGDADTVARVLGRQRLGTGWVSHLLQQVVADTWRRAVEDGTLQHAADTYAARRQALVDALATHDIVAHGASGLNVWVPVAEEVPVVQGLAAAGWAVQAGEPFRDQADPGVRVTVAALPTDQAPRLADAFADVLAGRLGTRRG